MRDRLIELIGNAERSIWGKTAHGEKERRALIADYLLAEGVIVLPCKVGDTVYQTDGVIIYELEIFDIGLRKNKPYYETESIDFDEDAIGKTVFLTREEAKAKLKGDNE